MAQTKAQLLGPVVGDVVMDVSTLSLDAEGNKVGIGHTEPDLTLHVNGVDGLPSSSGSTPTGHLTIRNKATSTKGMFLGVSNASPFGSWIQAQDSANNATNYPLLLNPNGGNVGIGQTNPQSKLQIENDGEQLRLTYPSIASYIHEVKSNGDYAIDRDGTERLRITSDGTILAGGQTSSLDGGFTNLELRKDASGEGGSLTLVNEYDASASSTCSISVFQNFRNAGEIVFGRENANNWQSAASGAASYIAFKTNSAGTHAERLRITSAGLVGINTTPGTLLELKGESSKEATVTFNRSPVQTTNGGVIGEFLFENNTDSVALLSVKRESAVDDAYIQFATQAAGGGVTERLRITSDGEVQARRTRSNTVGDVALSIQPTDSTIHYGFRIDQTNNDLNLDRVGSGNLTTFRNDGLIYAKALQITDNLTPTSGRGIEIFEAATGVGQISSINRDANSWDELRLKGSEVSIYTGTSNGLGLYLQSTQSTLYGTSDGILNLDTTDGRGSFIRFKENGTSKAWVGCSEGLGTGGDQDDLGLRATGGFRLRTGTDNRIEITDEGQIALRPLTGGFTTQGAQHTYPGAAVSIQCLGVGPGTGTNIPQYGLYVDASQSSNDATLMTGIFATAKQNTEGSAIGVHGLYYRDWNSYSRKIGGLFQAPARASRYVTKTFNPGGGAFANTTATGYSNALATGGNQPDGTTPTSATYGDATALWGDTFRSDTDTSANNCDSIAIKATNRVTHGRYRTGLMVGIVDGNDTTDNSKNTQFVEYYTNSTYQRYYARNHKKQLNEHYPLQTGSADGSYNSLYNQRTAVYYYNRPVGFNQYSWYYFNTMGSSSARGGRLKIDISWTTGHASGSGEGTYSICYISKHSDSRVGVQRFTRYHQFNTGGSYYNWSSSPHLDIFESTDTGNSAGIWFRVRGHNSHNSGGYDAYTVHSFKIEASESNYNFSKDCSFKFVSNSTPGSAYASAVTISTPQAS